MPGTNRFRLGGAEGDNAYGADLAAAGSSALAGLTLSHRLDVHVTAGPEGVLSGPAIEQLADDLHAAGLSQVGVIELQAGGASHALPKLKAALADRGIRVGYVACLPEKREGVSAKSRQPDTSILKGNADVRFTRTRYDLLPEPPKASLADSGKQPPVTVLAPKPAPKNQIEIDEPQQQQQQQAQNDDLDIEPDPLTTTQDNLDVIEEAPLDNNENEEPKNDPPKTPPHTILNMDALTAALTPLQNTRDLPPVVIQTELAMRGAARALNEAPLDPKARQEFFAAQSTYLREATAHLYSVLQSPRQPMTPSTRTAGIQAATALMSNIVGFTVPTAIASVMPSQYANAGYAAMVAAAAVITPEMVARVTRELGGATAQLRLATKNSSNVGTYKAIAGDLASVMVNVTIYAIANTAFANIPGAETTPVGKSMKALGSGILMSGAGAILSHQFAKRTLYNNAVADAKKLPIAKHNRSMPNGVYLHGEGAWQDRTSAANKALELTSRAVGAVLGAAAMFGVMTGTEYAEEQHGMNPVLKTFVDIMAGVGLFFAIGALVRMGFTKAMNDPDKHANKFGIIGNEIVCKKIEASAMNQFEGKLDEIIVDLEAGNWPQTTKAKYDAMARVLSGEAFRTGDLDALTNDTDALLQQLSRSETYEGFRPDFTLPTGGTVTAMGRLMAVAAESLQIARDSVAKGGALEPELRDVKDRIRDIQSHLIQCMFQLGGSNTDADPRVHDLASKLLPMFAALRKADRMERVSALADKIGESELGNANLKSVFAPLSAPSHNRVKATDMVDYVRRGGPINSKSFRRMIKKIEIAGHYGDAPVASAKLMIARNMLRTPGTPLSADDDRAAATNALDAFAGYEAMNANQKDAAVDRFRQHFMRHRFSAGGLEKRWNDLKQEAARPTGAAAARVVSGAEAALGREFFEALKDEVRSDNPHGSNTLATQMLEGMWNDIEAMPKTHRDLLANVMSVSISPVPIETTTYLQNDIHFHPTSYSGRVNSLPQLVNFMNRNGIERTNGAGIPSQQRNVTAKSRYYQVAKEDISYRSHDEVLARQYQKMPPEQQARIDLAITGIDVTDATMIGQELDVKLRTFPGVFKMVGEVTLKKEIIKDKNPQRAHIYGPATQKLLTESSIRGLPVILHCDRGVPGDKTKYADEVKTAIKQWAKRTTKFGSDPLALAGMDAPKIKPKIIWAHGAGISRFTADGNNHTAELDALLDDNDLKDILSVDLSWDFIAKDMLQNVHDQLEREALSQPMRHGLQTLLKAYDTFAEVGGLSDKTADLGDPNGSSMKRVAANAAAEQYLSALADFKETIRTEMRTDPNLVGRLDRLMSNHGTNGNNWLYVMCKHHDRLMFGTDALSVGIKAHGDAAYAMNARVLNPIYDIIDAVANAEGNSTSGETLAAKYGGVTQDIRHDNYVRFVDDKDLKKRRGAWESYLQTEKPNDWSTTARSHINIKDNDVVGQLRNKYDPDNFEDDDSSTEAVDQTQQQNLQTVIVNDPELFAGQGDLNVVVMGGNQQ
jgi:hypothetical protein